jgi:hypothetical protein
MTYDIGTHISFTFSSQPPYVKVALKGKTHEYAVGSKVILTNLIQDFSETINISVRHGWTQGV